MRVKVIIARTGLRAVRVVTVAKFNQLRVGLQLVDNISIDLLHGLVFAFEVRRN